MAKAKRQHSGAISNDELDEVLHHSARPAEAEEIPDELDTVRLLKEALDLISHIQHKNPFILDWERRCTEAIAVLEG